MKNCSTSRPPASHHAMPTMTGYVPVPPVSPVVSVSRNSHCEGSHAPSHAPGERRFRIAASMSPSGAAWPIASENHLRAERCCPYSFSSARASSIAASCSAPSGRQAVALRTGLRIRFTTPEPPSPATPAPAAAARFFAGFSAASDANLSSTLSLAPPLEQSRAQPLQNRQRRFFGLLALFARRADARRAALLARAPVNHLARFRQQQLLHTVERLAEADAARIRVIE